MTLMPAAGFFAAVCPVAPGNAAVYTDQIIGYVLWGVIVMFSLGVVVGLGSIVVGRLFSIPQASQTGVISIVVVFLSAVAYMILPGIVTGITGAGCI